MKRRTFWGMMTASVVGALFGAEWRRQARAEVGQAQAPCPTLTLAKRAEPDPDGFRSLPVPEPDEWVCS